MTSSTRPSVLAFVYGEGESGSLKLIQAAAEHLLTWADQVAILYYNRETDDWHWTPESPWDGIGLMMSDTKLEHVRRGRALRWAMAEWPLSHVAILSPLQVVATPTLVLPAVRAYPSQILLATHYWMWSDGYRVDGLWKPRRMPLVYPTPMIYGAHFRSGEYWPEISLEAQLVATTDIEIQDYTYFEDHTRNPLMEAGLDLRPYSGVQLLP